MNPTESQTHSILSKIGSLINEVSSAQFIDEKEKKHIDNILDEIQYKIAEIAKSNNAELTKSSEKDNIISKFQYLFDISKTGYFILDNNLNIAEVNNAALLQIGIDRKHTIGSKLDNYITPEHQEKFFFFTRKIINTKSKEKCELCFKKRDKEQFWVVIEGVLLSEGTVGNNNILLTSIDISERKAIEETLKKQQALLESLLKNIPIVFWANDRKGKIIIQSKESVKSWGNLIGKTPEFSEMMKGTLQKWRENSNKALNGEVVKEELSFVTPDGQDKSVYSIMAPVWMDDIVTGAIGMNIDITEKLKADKTIVEKEKLYRTLAENITGIPYRLYLENGSMVFFNDMVTELTGYKPEELLSDGICCIDPIIIVEDRKRVMDKIISSVKNNSPFIIEYKIRHRDGSIRNFIERGKPVINEVGKPQFIDGVIFDVTERRQVQDALKTVTDHYLTLAETVPVGIYRTEKNGDCFFVNERWCDITGLTSDNAVGLNWIKAIHKDDKDKVISNWSEMAGKKKSFKIEHRFVKEDKTVVWVINHAHAEVDSSGNITGYVGTLTDITERKQSEEIERRYFNYLKFLSDFSLKINAIINIDELYNYVGQTVYKLLANSYLFVSKYDRTNNTSVIFANYGFEKYIKKIIDFTNQDITRFSIKISEITDNEMKLFTSGTLEIAEEGLFTLSSRKIPKNICTTIEALLGVKKVYTIGFTKSNKFFGGINILSKSDDELPNKKLIENIVSQASIVLQRLIAETELKQRSNDLVKAQKIGKIGSFNADIINKTVQTSEELYKIFSINPGNNQNLSLEEFIGEILLKNTFQEDTENLRILLKNIFEKGEKTTFEYRILKTDNEIKYLEINTDSEFDNNSNLTEVNGLIKDISEQKRNQKVLKELNEQLAEKNNELEQLVFISSHDLRAPLVNIQGFTEELRTAFKNLKLIFSTENERNDIITKANEIINTDISEALGFIINSSSKMDALINGLLKVSRMGKTEIFPKILDMNKIIRRIISNFEYSIKESDINVEIETLPQCYADEALIDQVFSNLIDNAIKYLNPKRKGNISISGIDNPENSVYIIRDNGIGIPEKFHSKVFAIFQRVDNECRGEGLGLSIVKRIIEKHNGKIWLDSKPGVGTKIYFSLPKANYNN